MPVQVREKCRHCQKDVVVTLNHTPSRGAAFWYHCPHCFDANEERFRGRVLHYGVVTAVMGLLMSDAHSY
jgi:hypothetical protein